MPARRGQPTGRCGVCSHPERVRIELLLATGAGQTSVARKYGLSKDAIHRHWHAHVGEERRAALIMGPVQREALAAQIAEESASVLDHYRAIRAGLYTFFSAALEAGDRVTGSMVAGRLKEVNDSIARLTGQLASSPLIQNNTTINNNLSASPEYRRLCEGLMQLGRAHPQVRPDIIALLKRLDTEPELAPAPSAPLLIDHKESF